MSSAKKILYSIQSGLKRSLLYKELIALSFLMYTIYMDYPKAFTRSSYFISRHITQLMKQTQCQKSVS